MTRTALLALATLSLVACKEDPSGPTTSASQPTGATDPDTTGGSGGETVGLTATSAASGDSGAATDTGDTTDGSTGSTGSTGGQASATSPTGATTNPTTNPTTDPTNGPDPTETAFIVPMTDEGGSDPSGGDPTYGQCGWSAQNNFYDCADAGGSPGAADPQGIDPIACPDGLQEGADCNEQTGPVKNVGCCAPGGTLYYCTSQGNFIVKQECGA